MTCKNCNTPVDDNFQFCPNCGARIYPDVQPDNGFYQQNAQPQQQEIWDVFRQTLSSKQFFAVCVLMTVSTATNLLLSSAFSGVIGAVISSAISVIAVVAMWMLYNSAVQNKGLSSLTAPFKTLKVLTTFYWVLGWVMVGLLAVVAVVCLVSTDVIAEALELIKSELPKWYDNPELLELYGEFMEFGAVLLSRAMFITCLMMAVGYTFINIFCYGNIRKCAASFEETAVSGQIMLRKLGTVKIWLIVLGVLNGISALNSWNFLIYGCNAAVCIILSILLGNIKSSFNCE